MVPFIGLHTHNCIAMNWECIARMDLWACLWRMSLVRLIFAVSVTVIRGSRCLKASHRLSVFFSFSQHTRCIEESPTRTLYSGVSSTEERQHNDQNSAGPFWISWISIRFINSLWVTKQNDEGSNWRVWEQYWEVVARSETARFINID